MDDPRRLLDDPDGSALGRSLIAAAQADAPPPAARARAARRLGVAAVLAAGAGTGSQAGAVAAAWKLAAALLALGGVVGLAIWQAPARERAATARPGVAVHVPPPVYGSPGVASAAMPPAPPARPDARDTLAAVPAPATQPGSPPRDAFAAVPAPAPPTRDALAAVPAPAPQPRDALAMVPAPAPQQPPPRGSRAGSVPPVASQLAHGPAVPVTPAEVPGAPAAAVPEASAPEPAALASAAPASSGALEVASPEVASPEVASPEVASGPSRLAAEVALVDRARSRLRAGDHPAALAALAEYHQRFAGGDLDAEADVVTIEILIAQRELPRARALGTAFFARFPRSPLAQRVHSLLDHLPK